MNTEPEEVKTDQASADRTPPITDDEIFNLLGEETEAKFEIDDTNFEAPPVNNDDFTEPALEPEAEPEPEKQILSYDEQAKLFVAFLDNSGSLFLPPLYQRKMFPGELANKLKALKFRLKAYPDIPVSADDKPVYEKYLLYKDLVQGVPFSKQEINLIVPPLSAFLEKHQMKSGPEVLLMFALGQVVVPRLMPMFVNLD